MIVDKKLINRNRIILFEFIMEKSWLDAVIRVLREEGRPMNYREISDKIDGNGYYKHSNKSPGSGVENVFSRDEDKMFIYIPEECGKRGRKLGKGSYTLVGTPSAAQHSHTAGLTVGRATPVDLRKSTVYDSPYKKHASDFIDSECLSVLFDDEKKLLELIVNFCLPLVEKDVCFADILDDMEKVEFSPEEKERRQPVDGDLRRKIRKKLDELTERIKKIEEEEQYNNMNNPLLNRMRRAAEKARKLLDKVSGEKVVLVKPLGEFVPGDKPKVIIYYKNIENFCKSRGYERWEVMAGVFVHEMFHAWNYFRAGKNPSSVLAIDEPMVEFETLYFLKELETYTRSQFPSLHDKVLSVSSKRKDIVQNKQSSIGDVAAYGFGYYLFEILGENNVVSIDWIETYSERSDSIDGSDKTVEKAVNTLTPIYPFKLEDEYKVMIWFRNIIFDGIVTSVTAGKSSATKIGSEVSLRDLVLACIKVIGRKYFEAKELYAFAPIFKLCAAVPGDLEDVLKQQLDELVKDGVLETLSDDCYSRKLAGVEEPISKVKTPAKSKGGYTRGSSIPFAVEFPDGVIFADNKAVKTFIKSLQKIGLSNVQSLGIMIQGYNLVSDVERPSDGKNKWQDYVDNKYIYTKLGNEDKKRHLYQIANELGINIKIYDI